MNCPLKIKEPECRKCFFSKTTTEEPLGSVLLRVYDCDFPYIGKKKIKEVRIWRSI